MNFNKVDQAIAERMSHWGIPALRISFAIIFFWFGILKPFGLSSASELLKDTVAWLPFGQPDTWLVVIGWWEVAIGITFMFKRTTRIAIALLFLQMLGTFMPFVFLPEVTVQNGNYLKPTLIGQYILKNVMIISSALILGGTFYQKKNI
ncbi:DoxX family protein [Flagellimonas meridianipacifica]|uniref:DoxX-like protein n=1 Tax=Flagellimonas meridianipacifica TaxID=1080225 RepID=A0A2T0MFP5_9FLAO|nr:DoxX family protein [Allomuricauda pacifica]PRX56401.1 DoxX-like protein [Allomuricauda pacifica]